MGAPPGFNNFVKWYTYPVFHSETSRMTASLEHILELLPLQNHIERQLFTNRVQVVLEVLYPRVQIFILSIGNVDFFHQQSSTGSSPPKWRRRRRMIPWGLKCDCIKTVVFVWNKIVDLVVLLMHPFTFSDDKKIKIGIFRVDFY